MKISETKIRQIIREEYTRLTLLKEAAGETWQEALEDYRVRAENYGGEVLYGILTDLENLARQCDAEDFEIITRDNISDIPSYSQDIAKFYIGWSVNDLLNLISGIEDLIEEFPGQNFGSFK